MKGHSKSAKLDGKPALLVPQTCPSGRRAGQGRGAASIRCDPANAWPSCARDRTRAAGPVGGTQWRVHILSRCRSRAAAFLSSCRGARQPCGSAEVTRRFVVVPREVRNGSTCRSLPQVISPFPGSPHRSRGPPLGRSNRSAETLLVLDDAGLRTVSRSLCKFDRSACRSCRSRCLPMPSCETFAAATWRAGRSRATSPARKLIVGLRKSVTGNNAGRIGSLSTTDSRRIAAGRCGCVAGAARRRPRNRNGRPRGRSAV